MKALLAMALLTVLVSGCWDAHEINEVAVICCIGIDMDARNRTVVALEALNPAAVAKGTTGQPSVGPDLVGWVFLEPASSIAEALDRVGRRIPRLPFVGQLSGLVFGERLAAAGVAKWIDYVDRNELVRRSIGVVVADTALGVMQRTIMEELPIMTMEGLARHMSRYSLMQMVTLNDFLRHLAEPGIEPTALHAVGRPTYDLLLTKELVKSRESMGEPKLFRLPETLDPRAEQTPERLPEQDIQGEGMPSTEQTVLAGIAAFHGDRLRGYLDGLEARGFLWLYGGMTSSTLTLAQPGQPESTVVLRLDRLHVKHVPTLEGSLPRTVATVRASFSVMEAMDLDLLDAKTREALEQTIAQAIQIEARASLDRVQKELRTDIYGFGSEFHRRFPRWWREAEERWDDLFPELPVEIKVEVALVSSGLTVFRRLDR